MGAVKKKRGTWLDRSSSDLIQFGIVERVKKTSGYLGNGDKSNGAGSDRGPDGIHAVNWIGEPSSWEDVLTCVASIPRKTFYSIGR
jgi:hypothetical protein